MKYFAFCPVDRANSIRRILPLLLIATASAASPAAAQIRLEAGTPIRVVVDSANVTMTREGTIVSVYPDVLTLESAPNRSSYTFPVQDIRELYGYAPRNVRRSAWRGAQLGGFVGVGLGAVGSVAINEGLDGELKVVGPVSAAIGLVLGAAVGGITGALRAESGWEKYQLPRDWRAPPPPRRSVRTGTDGAEQTAPRTSD